MAHWRSMTSSRRSRDLGGIRALDLPPPIFRRDVVKLEDLEIGMELQGTVLNVVDFGAFVDVGLHDSGLVHVSQMANRFVRDPHDVVAVGDQVRVWVTSIDQDRRRVALTMIEPGTEQSPARTAQGEAEIAKARVAAAQRHLAAEAGQTSAQARPQKPKETGCPDYRSHGRG